MRLLIFFLLSVLVNSQRDNEAGTDEGTVRSKPVIVRLPKNRLSPELHSISSLKEQVRTSSIDRVLEASGITLAPAVTVARPIRPQVESVTIGQSPLRPPVTIGSVPVRPPSQPRQQPQLQLPNQPNNNLLNSALTSGSGLSGILANNPSLLKLLQGIGSPPGLGSLGGSAGPPSGISAFGPGLAGLSQGFGQNGLLAPIQGALPSLGQPPPFPGLPGTNALPPGSPNNGLLNVISSLGRQLGGAVGFNNIIPGSGSANAVGPSIPRISGLAGPPVAGLPNIPGIPVFPGAITPGGQLDVLQLISAISRRAFNGTAVTDVLPPNQIQRLADNLTNTLLPDTPDIDLNKYMGRWFEGINSPRASDQRCVVHHYGGLTENGKTATYTALKIYREASEFGQVRYSIGYAFRGGRQEGMLQMHTSEAADPVPYWIYKVGPVGKDPFGNEQYEYAIVSNWIKYPVMVLVRDPDQFKRDHEESVLKWLEKEGFINGFVRAFNLVQPVSYQNCQYADSTFELFG